MHENIQAVFFYCSVSRTVPQKLPHFENCKFTKDTLTLCATCQPLVFKITHQPFTPLHIELDYTLSDLDLFTSSGFNLTSLHIELDYTLPNSDLFTSSGSNLYTITYKIGSYSARFRSIYIKWIQTLHHYK